MKNILCFGDSNTYGLRPDGAGRYDFKVRYPGRLQLLLGDEYHIIEEGCPGRTTIYEDALRPHKKGIDYLLPCLISHRPVDLFIIMLGTNDCKRANAAAAREIAAGLSQMVALTRENAGQFTQILIVAPIHLGEQVWKNEFDPEFDQTSITVSKALAQEYRQLADETGCLFLDAASVCAPSPIDEEHLDAEGHAALAQLVANQVGQLWN